MSTETATRKKRSTTDSAPAPDGDHRKRRRNRTTQSCLNCHTSKRMCDRKRPACARCTQLGLTGLCVYEVDDPSQRSDAQDESSRLLKRVAELEGVIRELKNKPHPRWVQSSSSSEDFEKWHSRQPGSDESCSSNAPSPPNSSSSSERGETTSRIPTLLSPFTKPGTGFVSSIHLQSNVDGQRKSPYSPDSPLSPALLTPNDDYPLSHISTQGSLALSSDYDIASMFLAYPSLIGCGEGHFPSSPEGRGKQISHCGCLHETSSYNAMLELSLRLRKACEFLSKSASHQVGGHCQLHQRVSELDAFTTNALGDIHSPTDLSEACGHPTAIQNGYRPSQIYPTRSPPQTRGQSVPTWDLLSSTASSPLATPLDDSFMTWEPSRRP